MYGTKTFIGQSTYPTSKHSRALGNVWHTLTVYVAYAVYTHSRVLDVDGGSLGLSGALGSSRGFSGALVGGSGGLSGALGSFRAFSEALRGFRRILGALGSPRGLSWVSGVFGSFRELSGALGDFGASRMISGAPKQKCASGEQAKRIFRDRRC